MNRSRLAVACLVAAGCARPVELVTAPLGTRSSVHDAGIVERARATVESQIGSWSGTGKQSDGRQWPLRVELTAEAGRCGTIVYPTVPCRGVWVCSEAVSADGWRQAIEAIDSGACIDGGTFRYRIRGDAMEWSWSKLGATANEESLTARGVLSRNGTDGDDADTATPDWDSDDE